MAQFLADLFALFATVPFLSFILIYMIALYRTKSKKESIRWAIHITMFLMLFTIFGMLKSITGTSTVFWWLIVLLLIAVFVIIFLQWKLRGQVQVGRAIRSVWLLGFLLFIVMYIILIPIGIAHHYG